MVNLKYQRKEAGYTQQELAKIVGTSQGSIAQWETGRHLPRVDTLRKLADLFGCTIDDLLREEPEERKENDN